MPWREKWRHQERPDADQIPTEYSLGGQSNGLMLGYFTGVVVLAYLLLSTVGTRSTVVAGLPVLLWLLVGIAVCILIGLYFTLQQHHPDETTRVTVAPTTDKEGE